MAKSSVHFILKDKSDYKDLAPVFEKILMTTLEAADQVLEEDELQMILNINLEDLNKNCKPEGYLRKARVRIVFPLDRKEFYIQSYTKHVDLADLKDKVVKFLDEGGVKYNTSEDDDIKFDLK